MQGIQRRCLRIGKKGRAHKDVGVPEGNVSSAQGSGCIVAVGIEVVENVAAGQYAIRKQKAVEEQQDEEGQYCSSRQGRSEAAHRTAEANG